MQAFTLSYIYIESILLTWRMLYFQTALTASQGWTVDQFQLQKLMKNISMMKLQNWSPMTCLHNSENHTLVVTSMLVTHAVDEMSWWQLWMYLWWRPFRWRPFWSSTTIIFFWNNIYQDVTNIYIQSPTSTNE